MPVGKEQFIRTDWRPTTCSHGKDWERAFRTDSLERPGILSTDLLNLLNIATCLQLLLSKKSIFKQPITLHVDCKAVY